MFEMLASRLTLRSTGLVPVQETVTFVVADRRNGSINLVMRVSGRTAGSVRAILQASFDAGQTYPAQIADTGTVSTSTGVGYLRPKGALPPHLRVVLTPSGAFDGSVGLIERASGLLNTGFQPGFIQ